jgi:hypothetical protein
MEEHRSHLPPHNKTGCPLWHVSRRHPADRALWPEITGFLLAQSAAASSRSGVKSRGGLLMRRIGLCDNEVVTHLSFLPARWSRFFPKAAPSSQHTVFRQKKSAGPEARRAN